MTILIESCRLRIFTSPKVLSTSLKHLAFETDTDQDFSSFRANGRDVYVHRFYPLGPLNLNHLGDGTTSIAIVRDPVARFVSMYKNRILNSRSNTRQQYLELSKLGLDPSPSLNQLVLRLEEYRAAAHDIQHHSAPQAIFLGGDLRNFDHAVNFSNIQGLIVLLQRFVRPNVTLQHL